MIFTIVAVFEYRLNNIRLCHHISLLTLWGWQGGWFANITLRITYMVYCVTMEFIEPSSVIKKPNNWEKIKSNCLLLLTDPQNSPARPS